MTRNRVVLFVVLFLLAAFGWAGWANFEYRRQQAARIQATLDAAGPMTGSAADAPMMLSPLKGQTAPAFTLENLSGKKVSLADYKGKALMINFWATWCGPCKLETPWIVDLRNRYAGQGFEVLGISEDDIDRSNAQKFGDEKQEIARFVEQMHMPYPVLIDGDTLSRPYGGLDDLPTSFYVDRNGTVVASQIGVTSKDDMEADIRKALGK